MTGEPIDKAKMARLYEIAYQAISGAIAQDRDCVNRVLTEIAAMRTAGFPAVELTMILWGGLLRYHMFGTEQPGMLLKNSPTTVFTPEGERFVVGSARADTELSEAFLWAVAAMEALIMEDEPRWERVWDEGLASGNIGVRVLSAMEVVACTIAHTPFGYASQTAPTGVADD